MNQIDVATFGVGAGEEVTVEVVAVQVGEFSTFVVDGGEINPLPGVSPKTYRFRVTQPPNSTHFGMVSGAFPAGTPDGAKYQIFVSGDQGGGRFTGPDILKSDLIPSADLEFRVHGAGTIP
ncbi:MAG: hypothetical protein M3444_14815 [Acidobacteriota bacterium]|nr:hypothetical protein [Acidobacteriota bacterium]MDQ5837842.1 hypothetical protein [Acidobacteriota bacterium]